MSTVSIETNKKILSSMVGKIQYKSGTDTLTRSREH